MRCVVVAVCFALTSVACAAPAGGSADLVARRTETPPDHSIGRLGARVTRAGSGGLAGLRSIVGDGERGATIFVPAGRDASRAAPLMLLLHGAGGSGARVIRSVQAFANSTGTIVVAPDSRGSTWDFIRGPFGPDVAYIDSLLQATFGQYDVDRDHLTIAGFSDGASYALSLGLTNGDLFQRVVAFSPGMAGTIAVTGHPRVFISHGTMDQILDIDRTSRTIVPRLQREGYAVRYREFTGPHTVPPEIAREAFDWMRAP